MILLNNRCGIKIALNSGVICVKSAASIIAAICNVHRSHSGTAFSSSTKIVAAFSEEKRWRLLTKFSLNNFIFSRADAIFSLVSIGSDSNIADRQSIDTVERFIFASLISDIPIKSLL